MALSRRVRAGVLARAGLRCEYCRIAGWPLTVEHIVPPGQWSLAGLDLSPEASGPDETANLAAACILCNVYKADRIAAVDPITGERSRLFHPRRDRWEDHFAWDAEGLELHGTTVIGRATERLLRVNSPELLRQRHLLRHAMRGGGPRWP